MVPYPQAGVAAGLNNSDVGNASVGETSNNSAAPVVEQPPNNALNTPAAATAALATASAAAMAARPPVQQTGGQQQQQQLSTTVRYAYRTAQQHQQPQYDHRAHLIPPAVAQAQPFPQSFNQSLETPQVFQNMKLRRGKWTQEEEDYAAYLIHEFEQGTISGCQNGCTLRAFLSKKLHCAPMRISKKYAGECCCCVCVCVLSE